MAEVAIDVPDRTGPTPSSYDGGSPGRSFSVLQEDAATSELPAGSFGAGGWAPGGNGQYPRLTPAEAVIYRKQFRQLLLRRHYSVLRGWKALDRDKNGRLSIFEFMRGCQDLGIDKGKGPRNFWDALDIDRSGYISLEEIDMDLAKLLGSLAITIHVRCGSLDKAWDGWFNKRGYSSRVPKADFVLACEEIGFPGDGGAAWEALRADLATVGVSRPEFDFLQMWFARPSAEMRSPMHPEAELASTARIKDDKDMYKGPTAKEAKLAAGRERAEFKKLLLVSYGTFVRAWREGLDRDHNGILDYQEFKVACQDVGFAGSKKVCWQELDADGNGTVSLRELDKNTAEMIEKIYFMAEKRYGSWDAAWQNLFDTKGNDRVSIQGFVESCRLLGYGGNAERLFELLDTDRTRYLSLETTQWIEGAVLGTESPPPKAPPQDVGRVNVTGGYRQPTMSQARLLDKKAREMRIQQRKLNGRAAAEIPGSSVFAQQSHIGATGFTSRMHRSNSVILSSPSGSPRRFSSTWSGNLASLEPKEKPKSRDPVGHREAPPLPQFLTKREKMALVPVKVRLDRPMAPQAPGKGGWPLPSHHLTCPLWGGEGKPLPRKVSCPSTLPALGTSTTSSWGDFRSSGSSWKPEDLGKIGAVSFSDVSATSLAKWRGPASIPSQHISLLVDPSTGEEVREITPPPTAKRTVQDEEEAALLGSSQDHHANFESSAEHGPTAEAPTAVTTEPENQTTQPAVPPPTEDQFAKEEEQVQQQKDPDPDERGLIATTTVEAGAAVKLPDDAQQP